MADTKEARDEAQRRVVEALARHTSYLHRAATAQVNRTHEVIDELGRELTTELQDRLDNLTPAELSAFVQGKYTTDRLKGVRNLINRWAERLGERIDEIAAADFEELAGHEASYARDLLANVLEGEVPAAPTAGAAYAAAASRPVLGEFVEDMLADIPAQTRKRVYSRIREGISGGQTNAEIIRALRGTKDMQFRNGLLQTTRNDAERVVRTARGHISNVSYEETYKALGVEEVVWVSTLDGRTSKICASRDSQRWRVDEQHPRPPAHPNCRSSLAPAFDGEIMGQRPYVRAFKPVGQVPKSKRPDDMVGQVSAKTTYSDWFARQPASFQKEWLGPSRYKLYRDGGYKIDRFVDPKGGQYTLEELRQRDRETFDELFG